MLLLYKITFFLLSLYCFSIGSLSQAMDPAILPDVLTSCSFYKQSDYEKAIFTAQQDASFTFQVNHKDFPPFTIHFTNHVLPISALSEPTYQILRAARTIVLEPIPWDDEPEELLRPRLKEIFKEHLINPTSHQKLKSELSEQDYKKLIAYC